MGEFQRWKSLIKVVKPKADTYQSKEQKQEELWTKMPAEVAKGDINVCSVAQLCDKYNLSYRQCTTLLETKQTRFGLLTADKT